MGDKSLTFQGPVLHLHSGVLTQVPRGPPCTCGFQMLSLSYPGPIFWVSPVSICIQRQSTRRTRRQKNPPFPLWLFDWGVQLRKEKGNSWLCVFMDVEFIAAFWKQYFLRLQYYHKNPLGHLHFCTRNQVERFIHSSMLVNDYYNKQPINYHMNKVEPKTNMYTRNNG